MSADDLEIGVQVSAGLPGVTPVAFVCAVEAIDGDGEKRYVTVTSNGLSDVRRARLLDELTP